jgi:hypothetical protein
MTKVRFFVDESVNEDIAKALRQREPTLELLVVNESGAPPKGTLDPELLVFAENQELLFVTSDQKTMWGHLSDHFAAGRHTWGVVRLTRGYPIARYVQDLLLIWHATTKDEWFDRADCIPY